THYMDEVEKCDRVFVMREGELIGNGTPKEIFEHGALLERSGMELPTPAIIAAALKSKGVDVGLPLSTEELKEKLCELLPKI
ncbi:MAG: hypothetical protein J6Y44_02440, partial [Clostridia bacterium]|nr:hypothetical protein [Clostridia bacterium]